ncbi:pentatricopeptide repeat-containing protein At3g56030, mitochondrial [Diospyros lotus]|uniref:pentatricopeptide repeat-containing protein At3g56030, mitochondrial n=1 Tax=Diospyros lotus TaxID=55363 RepID=UPI00225493D9|nr:pentatricopeptide repeat-containing protein At3g56030, mitochondrial [Diospyros lotus]XP_052189222.1 pentatricopeptide repeat-containing protein At3g56030, mitochondrial [Diospyros lotus]XP_052189223.1 pentatricopeptide repeat-containing protein At3g56030, mitochondrial [Diospyros lotus]
MQSLRPNSKLLLSSPSLLRYIYSQHPKPKPFPPQEPSSAYYDSLVREAAGNRDFAAIRHLLNKRVRDGFFNTANTFNFLATDPSIIPHLCLTLAQLDKGFARKSAYDSLIASLCKLHRTELALDVVDGMVRDGHGANACTFHPILNALSRKKRMDEAWRVLDLMKENRIPPDRTAYNYLLTAYCCAGDLSSAAGLLTRMAEEEGLEADARTYDALVLGACKAGKVEGAIVVLRRMEDDGVPPLYSTHAHVVGGLLKMGFYSQAVEFVMSYAGRDRGLDTENFGLLSSRLIDLKRFDEARLVLKEMEKMGLRIRSAKLKEFVPGLNVKD